MDILDKVPEWWARWRGAVIRVGALSLVVALALGWSWSERLPPAAVVPQTPVPSPIPSGDPFGRALALARAGMAAEALAAAKTAVEANPLDTLPPELSSLVVPARDDPFNLARAFAIAGFDDKAKEEVAKQLSARPERTVPPELRYVNQRPGEVFVDGRLDPARAWALIPNPRTWLEVALRDLGIAIVALLVVVGVFVPLLRRAFVHRYRVEAFQEEAATQGLGKTIAVLVEDEMQSQREEGAGGRLDVVHGADAPIALPDALKSLPGPAGWLAQILSVVPSNTSVVGGTLHGRGARGVGMTVALTSPSGDVGQSTTLWEDEFDPLYSPPAKDADPAASVEAHQLLARAAATWVVYHLRPGGGR